MASALSPSPASLDSVFSVLSACDHPFIMVGKYALNWMGVPVSTSHTVDILVRNSQAASIYQAFVATGEWLGVDESSMPTFIMGGDLPEYRSVQRLKGYDDKWYIRLCTEDSYRISVDTKKIQVPHVLAFNSVLVESEFHHNTLDRRPYLLTDEKIKFTKDPPITFPVFIPTIPEYIDSCLDIIQDMDGIGHKLPRMDMSYLDRYLGFGSPHQQDKLLAKVKNRKQLAEYFAEGERRQVERMKRIMERRVKYAGGSGPLMEIPEIGPDNYEYRLII